jgi:hypothetical protein
VAVDGAMGDLMLALTVLTSDDILFRAGASVPIEGNPKEAVEELYSRLVFPAEKPSLLIVMAPTLSHIGGDDFVEAIDSVSGGISLFGSLAATHRPDFSGINTCWNGNCYDNAVVLIALLGEVRPEFYLTSIPKDKIIRQRAVVTKAVKNEIQSINGLAPLQYLESVGLAENGSVAGLASFPFVLTLPDGSQMVRSAYEVTAEGSILAAGAVPQSARIDFSDCGAEFVLQSAEEITSRAMIAAQGRSALIFSCVARRWTLGAGPEAEIKKLAELLDDRISYQFAYSGGEICPVKNRDGRMVNRLHNFSLTICLL